MKLIWALSPFVLCVSTACSHASSDEALTHLKTIRSWAATAQMVAECWMQGTVPQAYAKQTLAKTQQEVSKESDGLVEPSASQLAPLQRTLQQLTIAVGQPDKAAIAAPLKQLVIEEQQLQSLIKAQGGS